MPEVVLRCRDVGKECDFEVRGDPGKELLLTYWKHWQLAHDQRGVPEEVVAKLLFTIPDEQR